MKKLLAVLIFGFAVAFNSFSTPAIISGITDYKFEPNPEAPASKMFEIAPKMYNWEVILNATDSTNGTYEIVQITTPLKQEAKASEPVTKILIDRNHDSEVMVGTNQNGIAHFRLHIGAKAPEQLGQVNTGLSIVFSGIGTGIGASTWIILPGSKIDQATPSDKGTELVDGELNLIRYVVTNDDGKKFQVDVMLCRKSS
jgi:hypothetical protein